MTMLQLVVLNSQLLISQGLIYPAVDITLILAAFFMPVFICGGTMQTSTAARRIAVSGNAERYEISAVEVGAITVSSIRSDSPLVQGTPRDGEATQCWKSKYFM